MATAVAVRPLLRADLEPLRWVVYRAYLEVLLQLYGPDAAAGYEVRSLAFMEQYLLRDPQGCFVAEGESGQPVGAVFCFVWGEVGWFGSLAVAPEWQGRGVGQALTRQAVSYLAGRDCRRIGLETWPQSPLVRHLYGKFGFRPARSTVKFSRPVPAPVPVPAPGPEPAPHRDLRTPAEAGAGGAPGEREWTDSTESTEWAAWHGGVQRGGSPGGLARSLGDVEAVTRSLAVAAPGEPRADYRDEVRVPLETGWADLAVTRDEDGEPAGFALCYTRRPGGGPVGALDVRLLCIAPGPGAVAALDRLLAACDARARRGGWPSVTVDVNLRHTAVAGMLRERRFRPVYELLRMERAAAGFDPVARSGLIECARWAG